MAGSDWVSLLPLVMLGLRSSPKDDSSFSPAEAVYGSPLSLPGEFLEHSEYPPEIFLRRVENAISLHLLKMKRDLSGNTLCKAWSSKT